MPRLVATMNTASHYFPDRKIKENHSGLTRPDSLDHESHTTLTVELSHRGFLGKMKPLLLGTPSSAIKECKTFLVEKAPGFIVSESITPTPSPDVLRQQVGALLEKNDSIAARKYIDQILMGEDTGREIRIEAYCLDGEIQLKEKQFSQALWSVEMALKEGCRNQAVLDRSKVLMRKISAGIFSQLGEALPESFVSAEIASDIDENRLAEILVRLANSPAGGMITCALDAATGNPKTFRNEFAEQIETTGLRRCSPPILLADVGGGLSFRFRVGKVPGTTWRVRGLLSRP